MPNYNTQVPPYSVNPGDVALVFNNDAPSSGQASQQLALPNYSGMPNNGRTISWQTIYGSSPSAINIVLQTAMVDVDTEYSTVDISTATGGGGISHSDERARELLASEGVFDHRRLRGYGASVGLSRPPDRRTLLLLDSSSHNLAKRFGTLLGENHYVHRKRHNKHSSQPD